MHLPQAGVVDSPRGALVAEADSPALHQWEAEEDCPLRERPAVEVASAQEDSAHAVEGEVAGADQS
jgi:hypothetical protein